MTGAAPPPIRDGVPVGPDLMPEARPLEAYATTATGLVEGAATVTGMAGYWMMAKMGLDFVATLVCQYGALHVLEE
jgi:hypothetical protein